MEKQSYTRAQRAALEHALKQQLDVRCPACGGVMSRQEVVAPDNVPYVRHRVWLLCTGCRRSVALDTR